MADTYYQVPASDIDAAPATKGHRLTIVQGIALIGASCLVFVSVITSIPAQTSAAQSTNLLGVTPSLRFPSSAVMKPGALAMLPGSGPFKKMALAALEANNLQRMRDVKVRHGADWADMPSDLRAAEAQRAMASFGGGATVADEEASDFMVKVEKEVVIKAKDMAGNTAPLGFFDPLGFSTDCSAGKLLFYREVEIKHGRIGMLASLGFLVAEQFHPLFGGKIDVPSYIAFQETPLQSFWPAVVIAIAGTEVRSVMTFQEPDETMDRFWTMKTDRVPGDFNWDPLGLRPSDPEKLKELQNKELNNGRLAMIAAAGMIAQELATGKKLF